MLCSAFTALCVHLWLDCPAGQCLSCCQGRSFVQLWWRHWVKSVGFYMQRSRISPMPSMTKWRSTLCKYMCYCKNDVALRLSPNVGKICLHALLLKCSGIANGGGGGLPPSGNSCPLLFPSEFFKRHIICSVLICLQFKHMGYYVQAFKSATHYKLEPRPPPYSFTWHACCT